MSFPMDSRMPPQGITRRMRIVLAVVVEVDVDAEHVSDLSDAAHLEAVELQKTALVAVSHAIRGEVVSVEIDTVEAA
jgi:hypothetical protein